MKLRILYGAGLVAIAFQLHARAATPCESLANVKLTNAKITSSAIVAAGAFVPPARGGRGGGGFANLPAFCRVEATLTPSADSDIKIELWLPQSGWNGKFQAVGNGGWAGSIPYPAIGTAVRSGLRRCRNRYRAYRQQCGFRVGTSGKSNRSGLSVDS